MQRLTVADAMRPIPPPLSSGADVAALADRFASEGEHALPVVTDDGSYAGVIALETVNSAAGRPDATAADLAVLVPTLEPRQRLDTVLDLLVRSDADGLPVASPDGGIAGWVSHRDVLAAYQRLLGSERLPRTNEAGRQPVVTPAGLG
jgi:chloride channel protein, CIC family